VQEILKIVVSGMGPITIAPSGDKLPDQPSEATQSRAPLEFHFKTPRPPAGSDEGVAVSETVGGGGPFTPTVTLAEVVPPGPEQLIVNAVV
jgi:hypothetical protein